MVPPLGRARRPRGEAGAESGPRDPPGASGHSPRSGEAGGGALVSGDPRAGKGLRSAGNLRGGPTRGAPTGLRRSRWRPIRLLSFSLNRGPPRSSPKPAPVTAADQGPESRARRPFRLRPPAPPLPPSRPLPFLGTPRASSRASGQRPS